MGKKNEGGIYASMKFPEYTFVEFPKYVTNKSGQRVIVQSAREELAVASEPEPDSINAVPPIVEERDKLAATVAELQAELARLRATPAAQLAPNLTPKPQVVPPISKPKV